jgi:hypothetical protein
MVVRHIPTEILSTFIALYVAFTFFISTNTIVPYCQQEFFETKLEALNDKV